MTKELLQILTLEIPQFPEPHVGFLEVCRQAHRETVNSAVYAHFLSNQNNPVIATLFLESLLELIPEERKQDIAIEDYEVFTEYGTSNGRIDILIQDWNNQSAIIIENKIYHYLNNDLEDYWKAPESQITHKIGIVLTLEPQKIEEDQRHRYVNITHQDWISKIREKGLPTGLSMREYTYLNDFIETMKRLTKSDKMDEEVKFYFENQQKIIKATEIYAGGKRFIKDQLAVITNNPLWDNYGNNDRWLQFWPTGQKEDIYYVVAFQHLYHPPEDGRKTFTIYIQIDNSALDQERELHELIGNVKEVNSITINNKGAEGSWKHFAYKTYELENAQLEGWVEFAMKEVKKTFNPLYEKLRGCLAG